MDINGMEAIYTAAWSLGVPPGTYRFEFTRNQPEEAADQIAYALKVPRGCAETVYHALDTIVGETGYCSIDFTDRCDLRLSRTASPNVIDVELTVMEAA